MARRSGFTPVPQREYPELRLGIWELSFLYLSRVGPGPGSFPEAQSSLLLSTWTQRGRSVKPRVP